VFCAINQQQDSRTMKEKEYSAVINVPYLSRRKWTIVLIKTVNFVMCDQIGIKATITRSPEFKACKLFVVFHMIVAPFRETD
jgi:hypothetical protein